MSHSEIVPECPTQKIGYPRKRDAERVVAAIFRREGDRGIHIYRCTGCSNWHLGHGLPPPLPFDEGRPA